MAEQRIGIVMNGVTGRMGTNQHLVRSICAIRQQGGIPLPNGKNLMPDPILVGRNESKLKGLAEQTRIDNYTTDLDGILGDDDYPIYFDALTTQHRYEMVKNAIAAGKHIYCEKPIAESSRQALELYNLAKAKNLKNGVVQDKLWLPGLLKLKGLVDRGFFGKILDIRADFGYWVFTGETVEPQRPSWNYRAEDGGGIILDMFCHFSYVLEDLFGAVQSVVCKGTTLVPERIDEADKRYACTAEDAAYAILELDQGIVAQINASWCTRVKRDDLLTILVNGTKGSAMAGLRHCWTQDEKSTPRCVWNPDIENPVRFQENWPEVDPEKNYDNAFKAQWELFLKHVACDEPFAWTLAAGAKNVLLAEKTVESWQSKKWLEVPQLEG